MFSRRYEIPSILITDFTSKVSFEAGDVRPIHIACEAKFYHALMWFQFPSTLWKLDCISVATVECRLPWFVLYLRTWIRLDSYEANSNSLLTIIPHFISDTGYPWLLPCCTQKQLLTNIELWIGALSINPRVQNGGESARNTKEHKKCRSQLHRCTGKRLHISIFVHEPSLTWCFGFF